MLKNKYLLIRTIFLLLSIILIARLESSAFAQDIQTISVDPQLTAVSLGKQVQLDIKVSNGWNVNSFDILIEYDAQKLSLASWVHGNYLSNLSCNNSIDQPGILELTCSQIDQPDVSGNGVLLELTLNSMDIGNARVEITETAFTNSLGITLYPQRRNGTVVVYSRTPITPTVTHTLTFTKTATPTNTRLMISTNISISTLTSTPSASITPTITQTNTLAPAQSTTETSTATEIPFTETATNSFMGTQPFATLTPTPEVLDSTDSDSETDSATQSQSFFSVILKVLLWFLVITVIMFVILGIIILSKFSKQDGGDSGLL